MELSLMPLSPALHVGALQHLYRATPGYWQLYKQETVPPGQAAREMKRAAETPGRYLMGVVQPNPNPLPKLMTESTSNTEATDKSTGQSQAGELAGLVDFRLDWPEPGTVYLGMLLIAERYQRQGLATAAWQLLEPWLAQQAQMKKVRLGVEQFNPGALQFFETVGFQLTGEADRVRSGEQLVRVLYMERAL